MAFGVLGAPLSFTAREDAIGGAFGEAVGGVAAAGLRPLPSEPPLRTRVWSQLLASMALLSSDSSCSSLLSLLSRTLAAIACWTSDSSCSSSPSLWSQTLASTAFWISESSSSSSQQLHVSLKSKQ